MRKRHKKPYSLSFLQINTRTSVKPRAYPMADILITFMDTVLGSSNLQSHLNTTLPSASCFTEIKTSDFFSQLAPYQNISEYLHLSPFPSISKEDHLALSKRTVLQGKAGGRSSIKLSCHIYSPKNLFLSVFVQ